MAAKKKKTTKTKRSSNGNGNGKMTKRDKERLMATIGGAAALGFIGGSQSGRDLLNKVPGPDGTALLVLGGGGLLLKPKGVWKDLAEITTAIGAFTFGLKQSSIGKAQGPGAAAAVFMEDAHDDAYEPYEAITPAVGHMGTDHDDIAQAYAQLGRWHTDSLRAAMTPTPTTNAPMTPAVMAEVDTDDLSPAHHHSPAIEEMADFDDTPLEQDAIEDVADFDMGDVTPEPDHAPATPTDAPPSAAAEVDF